MIFKSLAKGKFIRNVLILTTGALGAQLVNMLAIPFITRVYGPEAYGLMGSFVAIISIVIPIAALTYPIAIVLPKENSEAKGVAKLSIFITIIISSIFLLFIILFYGNIVDLLNLQQIAPYLYLIPIVMFFSGCMQILEQWMIRKNLFSVNAKAAFYQSIITNSGTVGLGILNPIAPILIIFSSMKNGLTALIMLFLSRNSNVSLQKNYGSKEHNVKLLAKKYRDFPIYRAPETLINDLSQSLPILMLASFFGPVSVGFYTIGRTVLSIPTQLIGKAVGDVFYPRITQAAYDKEDLTYILKKATIGLSLIGLIPFSTVIIFGPQLFSFIFGEEWLIAGEYARWIALWSFFAFINQPSVRTLPVINAQKFHLLSSMLMLIVRVIALLIGYLFFSNDLIAIALFSIAGALLNLGLIIMTFFLSRNYENRVL